MSPSATAAAADRATDMSETPVTINVDGQPVEVAPDTTIHGACVQAGIDTPTLCWAENLTPVNVCRVCVVELEGSRALVPSCSRRAEDGMVVQTDSPRVRHSRRMVLEFLGSGVDLSQATDLHRWMEEYGADPDRYAHEDHPVERIEEPVKIQDELYIRDYSKCVLCYKCVEACGDDAQHTYAITVSGRGFDARISTEFDVALPDSACVYCGNCVGVCPTGALQFKTEYDLRQLGRVAPAGADRHPHRVLVLRRRLQPRSACAGRADREGHLAGRPFGHQRPPVHKGPLRLAVRPRRMRRPGA